MSDTTVPIVLWENKEDNTGQDHAKDWDFVAAQLTNFKLVADKGERRLFSPVTLDRSGGGVSTVTPQGLTKASYRKAELARLVTALTFDFDSGVTPEEILPHFEGFEYVAYTSWSNSPELSKWRLVLPLATPVEASRWKAFWAAARAHFGVEMSDKACKDPVRMYYLPSHHDQNEGVKFSVRNVGRWLEPELVPALPEPEKKQRPAVQAEGQLTPWDDFDKRGSIAELLEKNGWEYVGHGGRGESWRHPAATADLSATILPADEERPELLHVFTSSTVFEADKQYSPYAVYTHLVHGGDFSEAARQLLKDGYGTPPARREDDTPWHYTKSVPTSSTWRWDGPLYKIAYDEDGAEKKRELVTSTRLYVDSIYEHEEEDVVLWELVAIVGGRERRIIVGQADICEHSKIVAALSAKGVDLDTSRRRLLSEYLQHIVQAHADTPRKKLTSALGWHMSPEREFCFVWGKNTIALTDATAASVVYHDDADAMREVACYDQRGTYEEWLDMARFCGGYPKAALFVIASLASPFVKRLGFRTNPIVQIATASGEGKSTVFKAAASIWGDPSDRNGQILNWSITYPGFERIASRSRHLPMFLEEIQKADVNVARQAMMDYANGKGKAKASMSSLKNAAPTHRFVGVLFSNGEGDITSQFGNDGIHARVLNLTGEAVFGDKDDKGAYAAAVRVDADAQDNYGHAGPRWVRAFLADASIDERMKARAEELVKVYVEDGMDTHRKRLMEIVARLRAVGEAASDVLGLDYDCDFIFGDVLRQLEATAKHTTSADVYDHLVDWVRSNAARVEGCSFFDSSSSAAVIGRTVELDGRDCVALTKEAVESWLRRGPQGLNLNALLERWKRDGRIVTEGAHLAKQVRFRGGRQRMIVLPMSLERDLFSDEDEEA